MVAQPVFEELSRSLNTPLLELGDLTVTTFFLVKAAALLVGLVLGGTIVRRWLVFRVLRRSGVDDGVKYAVARIAGYGVWVLGLLIGLPMIGIKLNSLMVAFGAVGIGIGLGLQKIAENFISGVLILFGRPVKVGDRIRVDGIEGNVTEIQSRVTLVRTNDNIIILVPNAHLVSGLVVNLTHNDRLVRFSFDVGVSYDSDPHTVRDCLLEVARGSEAILDDPEPEALFVGFGDSALNFQLRGFTRTMVNLPDTLVSEINFAIWYRLEAEGISIPFPQRDLHIKSMIPADLRDVG